jgi:hypothetical protein
MVDRVAERRVATLLFGSLGVAVGVGVGLRHVAAGDLRWRALLGLVALVAALPTVGAAIRRLLRDLHTPLKIIAVIGLVAIAAVVTWTLAPAVIATSVPAIAHGTQTPGDVGMRAEEVHLVTGDGVELWAWYVESRNGHAVVLRHGSGSTATAMLEHAAVLASHGYGVLVGLHRRDRSC